MSLKSEDFLSERRPDSGVEDGAMDGAADLEAARIHARRNEQRSLGRDVRRGESECAAASRAFHHFPADEVRTAEHPRGALDVAALKRRPDRARRDGRAVDIGRRHDLRVEAEPPAELAKESCITARAAPEAMIEAHDDLARAEPAEEHLDDERVRLHG